MSKVAFHRFRTNTSHIRRHMTVPRGLTNVEVHWWLARAVERVSHDQPDKLQMWRALCSQNTTLATYYALGRPYFKVHSAMMSVFLRTPMAIPATHFRVPFTAFEIALPTGQRALLAAPDVPILSMIVANFRIPHSDFCDEQLVMLADIGEKEPDGSPSYVWMTQPINHTDTLEFLVQSITNRGTVGGPAGMDIKYGTSVLAGRLADCFRVAVGVCMLGTSDPMFVKRDIPDGFKRKLKHPDKKVRAKAKSSMKAQGLSHGYVVGGEIHLPLESKHGEHADNDDTGRHLTWGHLRRAHFGWRKTKQGWRLRPIKMSRICPHLPLKPSRGYETPPSVDVGVT